MAVRLQDIARDLNLSAMTISKVLRGQAGVSSETVARVLQRAKELNYRPNATARSLRTGQTRTVGMVVSKLDHGRMPQLVLEVRDTLGKENYSLIVSLTGGDEDDEEREVQEQLGRQVDALIFCVRDGAAELPQAQQHTPMRGATETFQMATRGDKFAVKVHYFNLRRTVSALSVLSSAAQITRSGIQLK